MRRAIPMPRPMLAIAALLLAGCVGTTTTHGLADGLYFRPPTANGVDRITTSRSSAEIAQALRDAGYGDVRTLGDGSIRLRSNNPDLVDCGTWTQAALGNQAEFPGNSAKAVLMSGFPVAGLHERRVQSRSEVVLTPLSDGRYAVNEAHQVSVRYASVSTGRGAGSTVRFDESSAGTFADGSSCRASGLVARILG